MSIFRKQKRKGYPDGYPFDSYLSRRVLRGRTVRCSALAAGWKVLARNEKWHQSIVRTFVSAEERCGIEFGKLFSKEDLNLRDVKRPTRSSLDSTFTADNFARGCVTAIVDGASSGKLEALLASCEKNSQISKNNRHLPSG